MAIREEYKLEQAECWKCGCFQPATYGYGPMESDGVRLERALRATCDVCGSVVASSPEVAPLLRSAIAEQRGRTSFVVSSALLHVALDALHSKAGFDGSATRAALILVKAFLGTLVADPERMSEAVRMAGAIPPADLDAKKDRLVTFRASPSFFRALDDFGGRLGVNGWGEPFRRLLMLALASGDSHFQQEAKMLATIYA